MVDYLSIIIPIIITIIAVAIRIMKEIEKSDEATRKLIIDRIMANAYGQDIKDMQMLEKIEKLPEELKEVIVKQLIIPQKRGF